MKEHLTVVEAAKYFKKHPSTVRRWIRERKLVAEKIAGKVYLVSKSDMLEFLMTRVMQK